MIEAEIIAQGSVKGVHSGKHYDRAIRCHKILYEAMERMRLEVFEQTLTTEEKKKLYSLEVIVTEDSSLNGFLDKCMGVNVIEVNQMYDRFVKERSETNLYLHSGQNT